MANNFADATEAATVGYATGATLGNFDEALGTATAALTLNPNNYTIVRPLVQLSKKFIKQGINSSADKAKNIYYKKNEYDEEYHY